MVRLGSGPFALVGPTASGKSALGVLVALELGDIEIVSADSMQVYRGMDIGTAKTAGADRAGVAHHLIDVADPSQDWDVARFVAEARRIIDEVGSRGHRALFVGGTGLYVHALVDGFAVPGRWPEIVAQLEETASTDELYKRLELLDPVGSGRLEPGNRRRLVRALEVTIGSGRPFSSYGPGVAAFPPTDWRLAGVWLPREVVAARIEKRLASMLEAGFVDEVRALASRPQGLSRTARQALGYRELLSHVEEGGALGTGRRPRATAHPSFRPASAHVVAAGPEGTLVRVPRKPPRNTACPAERLETMNDLNRGVPARLELAKYEGLGNDFLVLVDLHGRHQLDAGLARLACDRHLGFGGDGLLRGGPAPEGSVEKMTFELRNADGSEAEMSGNGLRCLAHAAIDAGAVSARPGDSFGVLTPVGRREVHVRDLEDGFMWASTEMGVVKVVGDDERCNVGHGQMSCRRRQPSPRGARAGPSYRRRGDARAGAEPGRRRTHGRRERRVRSPRPRP